MDRVRLRQFCKNNMKVYKQFWSDHGEDFKSWFQLQSGEKLRKLFQLPRQEVLERLENQNFKLHKSFGTVLCAGTRIVDFVNCAIEVEIVPSTIHV